ncbi:23S rRNA pseudouridine(955/2504/2580) synthase RluC [Methylophaga frappieri]|nr:23S rRNA pseudouridine(955/2504/2580) synthase RluC [Methylophaga frappieri]
MSNPPQKSSGVQFIRIRHEQAGQRIDNFLITLEKGVPKSRIYRALRKGEVRVNKGRIKPTYKLQADDEVRIPPLRVTEKPVIHVSDSLAQTLKQQILYEDAHLLAINKPSGLAVHAGTDIQTGVIEALKTLHPDTLFLELVHRLDRDTSGCLLVAKSRQALLHMQNQMRSQSMDKHYLTLTAGHWQQKQTMVDLPLKKNTVIGGENMVTVDEAGKTAQTCFLIEQSFRDCQLMAVKLFTGRTHQIRVHAASQGHPVAGDSKYGQRDFNKLMKTSGLNRMFLHAWQLTLTHPETDQPLKLVAPLPSELRLFLDHLNTSLAT